jgi:hypothetical protein
VFWLTRPPYLRWAAATAVVVCAFAWDLHQRAEAPFPFAAAEIRAGTTLSDDLVEWRALPVGLMAMPDLSNPVAARDIPAGEPIVESSLADGMLVPEGWWSVALPLPSTAAPGSRVRLISVDTPLDVEGVVVAGGSDDLFTVSELGSVAVPPEAAADVAVASATGALVALLEP